ncbi:hypothetical protein J6590_024105 [Homalodisca vitripennis]|nr:hypothetical protein J6590_024105 [Homalodisca vitripennis]
MTNMRVDEEGGGCKRLNSSRFVNPSLTSFLEESNASSLLVAISLNGPRMIVCLGEAPDTSSPKRVSPQC